MRGKGRGSNKSVLNSVSMKNVSSETVVICVLLVVLLVLGDLRRNASQ